MKTNTIPVCRACGAELNDENWYASHQKKCDYICNRCDNERIKRWQRANREKTKKYVQRWEKANPEKARAQRTRANRKRGAQPFYRNKRCSLYLGVHVAEGVLSRVFKNVTRMPMSNPGFDFICGKGYRIDVKSSCLQKNGAWGFNIKRNMAADYFLCIAFDDMEDLNPEHVWLLPGSEFNHLGIASIRQGTIHKWDAYRLDITKVKICCNAIRSEPGVEAGAR